jgi:hypothetical protein
MEAQTTDERDSAQIGQPRVHIQHRQVREAPLGLCRLLIGISHSNKQSGARNARHAALVDTLNRGSVCATWHKEYFVPRGGK